MPRPQRSNGRDQTDRDNDRPAPRPNRRNSDGDSMALRDQDQSFASIASSLGLKRATDAHAGYLRALRQLPDGQRSDAIKRENDRLDRLEDRIRTRDKSDPPKMTRRLQALQTMRRLLQTSEAPTGRPPQSAATPPTALSGDIPASEAIRPAPSREEDAAPTTEIRPAALG
jgi:hypothetical protein